MTGNMKSALIACGLSLPVLLGVGWLADILTRDAIGLVVLSQGGDPSVVVKQSILGEVWPAMLLIWLISSAIVLCLAKAGLGAHHTPFIPPPPLGPRK